MNALKALRRIIDEAKDYASHPDRFRPEHANATLEHHHIYREGYRDGQLKAARVAQAGLEGEE